MSEQVKKLKVLGLRKIAYTDPQEYELRLHDPENRKSGYTFETVDGTEDVVRAALKAGGMPEGDIDVLFARVS